MKKVMYWLIGEKAGRTVVGTWNWLWGIPVDAGGKVAVAVAEESLQSMQEGVHRLAEAVAIQDASYQKAKKMHEAKLKELEVLNRQVATAQKLGNDLAARQTMTKVIQIEQVLPNLESMIRQAEQAVNQSKAKLNRERVKIESYKSDMQNMKDLAEVNEALAIIASVNNEFDIGSAKSQFEEAKNAVETRNLRTNALAALSENPIAVVNAEIEQMTLEDEVTRRLQQIGNSDLQQLN
jgi:phage shock protein A